MRIPRGPIERQSCAGDLQSMCLHPCAAFHIGTGGSTAKCTRSSRIGCEEPRIAGGGSSLRDGADPVRGEALRTCPTSGQMVRERRTTMRLTRAAAAPARPVLHLHPFASRFARVPYWFTGKLLPFLVTVVVVFFTIVLVAHLDQDETAITNAAFAAIATLGALSFSGARAVEEPARQAYVSAGQGFLFAALQSFQHPSSGTV